MKIKRMVSWICSMLVVAMVIGMIPTQTASAAIAMPDKVSKNTKTFNFTGKVGWYYDQGSKDEFGGYFKTLNEERKYFYGDNASKFKVSMKKDKDGVWHLTATGTGYVKLNLNSKVTSKNYEIVDITNKREVTTGYDQKTYSKINKKSGNYLIILVGPTHGKTEDVYFQVCDMDKFERVTKKLHLRVTVKDNPQTIEEIEWDQMMKELKEKDYSNSPDADLERVYDVWRAVDDWYNLFGAIGALKERGYFTKYDVLTDIDAAREFDPDWEKEYCKWNYAMWHVGVCEDNATMFTMLCDELGIESKLWANPVANHAANLVKLHGKWYFIDAQNGEFLQGWDKAPEWWKLNPSKFEKTYKVKVSDKSYDLLKDEYFDEKGRLFLDSDYDRESPSLALNDL